MARRANSIAFNCYSSSDSSSNSKNEKGATAARRTPAKMQALMNKYSGSAALGLASAALAIADLEDSLGAALPGLQPDKRQRLAGAEDDGRQPILRGNDAEMRELIMMNRVMMQQMIDMNQMNRVMMQNLMMAQGGAAAPQAPAAAVQETPKREVAPTVLDPSTEATPPARALIKEQHDRITKGIDKSKLNFERLVRKFVSMGVSVERRQSDMVKLEDRFGEMYRYPTGMRAWHCPLTLTEFDDVCEECVDDDYKYTILFKKGSSVKDVMLHMHHTMTTWNKRLTLRSSEKHRACLKARTTRSAFWQPCKEVVNHEPRLGGSSDAKAGRDEDPGTG